MEPSEIGSRPTDEATALRALVERLRAWRYAPPHGAPAADSQPRVTIRLGGPLPGLPFTLPLPPGGRCLGSAVYQVDGAVERVDLVVAAPTSNSRCRPVGGSWGARYGPSGTAAARTSCSTRPARRSS